MLIELEPAKPTFSRVWATGGHEDFLHAMLEWERTHARCGAAGGTEHLDIEDHDLDPDEASADGIRRVWFYCACGHQRLVLGQPLGGDMTPPFPRLQ